MRNKFKVIHGQARDRTKLYRTWLGIKKRCFCKTDISYQRYGALGITMYGGWINNFPQFALDVGEPPNQEHSIDRIDSSGNYEPGNVRWANDYEQSGNRRSCIYLEFNGFKDHIYGWSRRTGIKRQCIETRLKRGWSVEKTLTRPVDTKYYHARNKKSNEPTF